MPPLAVAVVTSDAEATALPDENHPAEEISAEGTTTNFVLHYAVQVHVITTVIAIVFPAPGLEKGTPRITYLPPPTPLVEVAHGPAAPSAVIIPPLFLRLLLLLTMTIYIDVVAAVTDLSPSSLPLLPIMMTTSTGEAAEEKEEEEEEGVLVLRHLPAMEIFLPLTILLRLRIRPSNMHTRRRRFILSTAPTGSEEGQGRITAIMPLPLTRATLLLVTSTLIDGAMQVAVLLVIQAV